MEELWGEEFFTWSALGAGAEKPLSWSWKKLACHVAGEEVTRGSEGGRRWRAVEGAREGGGGQKVCEKACEKA